VSIALPCVIIVGAGPAGCVAGLVLASNGTLSLLLEKGLPGKDKACGDAWIPSAVEELRAFDTDKLGLTRTRIGSTASTDIPIEWCGLSASRHSKA
jgi:flavin-dependent dehydrogenase